MNIINLGIKVVIFKQIFSVGSKYVLGTVIMLRQISFNSHLLSGQYWYFQHFQMKKLIVNSRVVPYSCFSNSLNPVSEPLCFPTYLIMEILGSDCVNLHDTSSLKDFYFSCLTSLFLSSLFCKM